MVPGIQTYFLSTPFLLIGGLILLSFVLKPMLLLFIDAFGRFPGGRVTGSTCKAMKRVLKVQDQLKRSADWRLAEAERVSAEIADAQAELWRFMDDAVLTGAFAAAAAAQSRRLDSRGSEAAQIVEAERIAMQEATARQKLVAKTLETLSREDAAARERKDLERLIEGFAGRARRRGAGGD